MSIKPQTGEVFQPGEIWQSPRGVPHKVMTYRYSGKRKDACMVNLNTGRTAWREWGDVIGWVIHQHADGRLAGPAG